MLVTKDSQWFSYNNDKKIIFKVTDVIIEHGEEWVYYKNIETEQHYHCLAEAFKIRFSPEIK